MNPLEVANLFDMKRSNVGRLLGKMAKVGDVKKMGRGPYVHTSIRQELTSSKTSILPIRKVRR